MNVQSSQKRCNRRYEAKGRFSGDENDEITGITANVSNLDRSRYLTSKDQPELPHRSSEPPQLAPNYGPLGKKDIKPCEF